MIVRANETNLEKREAMRGGDGAALLSTVGGIGLAAEKCRLMGTITLEKGCSIGYHEHHGECEIFYIIKGEALVSDKGSETCLRPGDYLITASGSGHSIACAGEETLQFVAVIIKD